MESVSRKSVVRKGFKNMIVLGLGLAVTIGFAPTTIWASFQKSAVQTCRFNRQYRDSQQVVVSADDEIIMARGGNRSSGGTLLLDEIGEMPLLLQPKLPGFARWKDQPCGQ
jgi:hypothetical protein